MGEVTAAWSDSMVMKQKEESKQVLELVLEAPVAQSASAWNLQKQFWSNIDKSQI